LLCGPPLRNGTTADFYFFFVPFSHKGQLGPYPAIASCSTDRELGFGLIT
jgi:hypothetical protein